MHTHYVHHIHLPAIAPSFLFQGREDTRDRFGAVSYGGDPGDHNGHTQLTGTWKRRPTVSEPLLAAPRAASSQGSTSRLQRSAQLSCFEGRTSKAIVLPFVFL